MPQSALSSKNRETRFAWYPTENFFVQTIDFLKIINIIVLTFISEVLYDFRQAIIGES